MFGLFVWMFTIKLTFNNKTPFYFRGYNRCPRNILIKCTSYLFFEKWLTNRHPASLTQISQTI